MLLTLTGCPICEDCLADVSSGTDTSGDGDGDGDGEPAVCGDGIVQPGEECDDGNADGCVDSASVDVASTLTEAVGYFKASNTGSYNSFGASLALSGDGSTLAIGAPHESSVANISGAVYVFVRNGAVWGQQAYFNAPNPEPYDAFGNSVTLSIDGNTLAVGAPQTTKMRWMATTRERRTCSSATAISGRCKPL